MKMEDAIKKIENEMTFQREKAKEFGSGIFKDDLIFARYDASALILGWVLKVLNDCENERSSDIPT